MLSATHLDGIFGVIPPSLKLRDDNLNGHVLALWKKKKKNRVYISLVRMNIG